MMRDTFSEGVESLRKNWIFLVGAVASVAWFGRILFDIKKDQIEARKDQQFMKEIIMDIGNYGAIMKKDIQDIKEAGARRDEAIRHLEEKK